MSITNTPLSIVKSMDPGKNPGGWPINTIVFATSYEKPPEAGQTRSMVYTLGSNVRAGSRLTPTLQHPKWGPIVTAPDFPEYRPVGAVA